MTRRISRGTPYILTATEIEQILKHLPPRVETSLAALMNLSLDEWRAQPVKVKAKQIVDHQNAGAFAATMAASERAIGDLEAAATPTIATDPDALLDSLIDGLHKRGLIVINPVTVKAKS